MRIAAAIAAVLASCSIAQAADLPVAYNVEEKPLKAAVSGTVLTFELYSDQLCTSLVTTQPYTIDQTSVSKLKLFTPVGGTKPPKTATIRIVMGGGQPAGAYLKVTGTGVVPVGGACQAQSGGSSGNIIGVSALNGMGGIIPAGPSPDYIFIGPTTAFSITSSQYMVASASLPMTSNGGPVSLAVGICYQLFPSGPLVNFASSNFSVPIIDNGTRHTVSAVGATGPGTGLFIVGLCVQNLSADSVSSDSVNGWVMVMH